MCFDTDSLPPVPVIRGAAVSHEDLVLEAEDGNRFAAFAATPDQPGGVGVAILPDVRGLYRFYEERGDDFDYMEHVGQTTPEGVQADVAAVVARLHRGGFHHVFTVGFCFGGRNSWLSAAGGHGLAGAIGFYGRPGAGSDGSPGPAQRAAELTAPILALQAGDDQNISAADNAAFEAALRDAGVDYELITYEGAPHSFFDRKQEEFASASEDAWTRVLAFIERHSRERLPA